MFQIIIKYYPLVKTWAIFFFSFFFFLRKKKWVVVWDLSLENFYNRLLV